MSTVSISYSSLTAAASEANSVAKKLGKYADSLYNDVYQKLNSYNGSWTSNFKEARTKINAKIETLRSEQTKYETYTSNLMSLIEECESVDESVKKQVSTLTASFKETHGINNSAVVNAINNFFTSVGNSTAFGRWVGGISDEIETGLNNLKSSIKEWFNFDGGADLLKGLARGALSIAIGVCGFFGALALIGTGVGAIFIAASAIGGVITAINGGMDMWNEAEAYSTTRNGDPATGKRRSQIDTAQDYLRSSFRYGADGEYYEYDSAAYAAAAAIDVVSFACTVINLVHSGTELLKKGYKWATGSISKTSDISLKSVFSKDTLQAAASKLKTSATEGITNVKTAIKRLDWAYFRDTGARALTNVGQTVKKEFLTFDTKKAKLNSVKNIASVSRDLLDGDDIWDVALKNFVLPSVPVFQVDSITDKGTIVTENVTVKDFYGVLDKLSSVCDVDIDISSIPEVTIVSAALPGLSAS